MTKKEFLTIVKLPENKDIYSDFIEQEYTFNVPQIIGGVKITAIERNGGGEGDGESMSIIFQVNDDRIYRVYGHHDSWNGNEWDDVYDITEVVPTQKTITVYEDVK